LPTASGYSPKSPRVSGEVRRLHWRPTPAKGARLPQYDVRLTRELANRRFAISIVRQSLRLITLHALDAIAIAAAALTAAAFVPMPLLYRILPALIAYVLVGLNLCRAYRAGDARRDAIRLVTGVGIGVTLAMLSFGLQSSPPAWTGFLIVFGLAAVVFVVVQRRIVDAIVHAAYLHGIGLRRALLIAKHDEYFAAIRGIAPHQDGRPAEDQLIVGYLTPDTRADTRALGSILEMEACLAKHDVSELIVASPLAPDILMSIAEACFERGVRVLVIPSAGLASAKSVWAEPTRIGRLPAYQLHPLRLELPALVLKRVCDIIVASIGIVVAAPLVVLVALAIKIESPGPIIFRQRRVGLGGRHFMMWKFRSMSLEAESMLPQMAHLNSYSDRRLFKLQTDPRVTRVGRVLRRFSLDELPQLVNILSGDMSVVGPRPPLPSEVEEYEPRHYVRLSVVPGLTGPWQVNGRNLVTDFEEVVRLERQYVEGWSLKSDVEIMLRTFLVVLSGRGAY
jgi:exopolysaccharide biosynthesis polyprenyl glycosylphosphotransferase